MPSVSGASGSSEASQIQSQNQLDDIKEQKKLDQAALDAQTAQQSEQAQQMMGQQAASQEMYNSLRLQAMGNVPSDAKGPEALSDPKEAAAARGVANTVMAALTANMSSMAGQSGGAAASGGDQHQDEKDQAGLRMGGMSSNLASFEDAADQRVRDAAKVAVYQDIMTMMNGMNDKRLTKDAIGEAISAYNQLLANKWEGKKNMPVYELDQDTGKFKMVGKKSMTYEEAQAERDKLKDQKDSISEMSQQDMLVLQQLMEKKNQLEQMISNVMKSGYEGGQAAIQALKAS